MHQGIDLLFVVELAVDPPACALGVTMLSMT